MKISPMVEKEMDELNNNILRNNVEISIYNLYPYVNDRMYYFEIKRRDIFKRKIKDLSEQMKKQNLFCKFWTFRQLS